MSAPPMLTHDEEALAACLRHSLSERDRGCSIAAVEQRAFERPTFYGARVITVLMTSGDRLELFLKDFGSYSKQAKGEMERRRERELRVYRDVLAGANLGTARYYGSTWNEAEGRFWLLLEHVDGTHLRHCHYDHWVRAAAWLASLQAHFARLPAYARPCGFLARHDAAFFLSRIEPAVQAVSRVSIALAGRVEKLLASYPEIVGVIAAQPVAFVHGCYTPTQILLDLDRDPARICPVDWELAALGSPLYDLATLSDGFQPPRLAALWDAYGDNAARHGLHVPDRSEMTFVVNAIRLHRIVTWLGKSVRKGYPPKAVAELVATGEQVSSTLS